MQEEQKPWLKTKLDNFTLHMETHVHLPFVVANGCCQIELENVASSTYDWRRLGVQKVAIQPDEADLLIVAGWINPQVAEELKRVHSSLVGRKSVIAVGACAISGGPYLASNQKPILASDILPVDVYVPGCPPRPESLIEAIRLLKYKLQPQPDRMSVLYSALKDNTRKV